MFKMTIREPLVYRRRVAWVRTSQKYNRECRPKSLYYNINPTNTDAITNIYFAYYLLG